MPMYTVSLEDLQQFVQQMSTQVSELSEAQGSIQQAADSLISTTDAATTQAQTTITGRLTELSTQVRQWDQESQGVQWNGQDSDTFRQANTQLAATIDQTQQQMTESIEAFRQKTAQLNAQLQDLVAQSSQAIAQSSEQCTRLGQAVSVESSAYQEAFNGSFAYGG